MISTLFAAAVLAGAPAVGELAPDFSATDTEGKTHKLSEMLKGGPVIVAFFPKAFTSGCTRELEAYRSRHAELEKSGGQLLAVSTDDLETMKKFKAELKAPYTFIPDPDAKVVKLFDAKMAVVNYASRVTYVIGQDRKVIAVQSGSQAIDPTGAIDACPLKKKG